MDKLLYNYNLTCMLSWSESMMTQPPLHRNNIVSSIMMQVGITHAACNMADMANVRL